MTDGNRAISRELTAYKLEVATTTVCPGCLFKPFFGALKAVRERRDTGLRSATKQDAICHAIQIIEDEIWTVTGLAHTQQYLCFRAVLA
jgi:hypothetical protein